MSKRQNNGTSARRPLSRPSGFIVSLAAAIVPVTSYCLAQSAGTQGVRNAPATPPELEGGLIGLLIVGAIIAGIYFRIKNNRERQEILSGKNPIVVRRYVGTQSQSYAAFQKEASGMAAHNYFPISQGWVPGQWSAGNFVIALLLCVILIGILVFIYMLVVKPSGTLTVTYERRAASAKVKTCPRCAEQIKAAAVVCHFCGQDFSSEEANAAPQISVDRGSLLEPPRKRSVKALIAFLIVLGFAIGVAAIGISDSSLKLNVPNNSTAAVKIKASVTQQDGQDAPVTDCDTYAASDSDPQQKTKAVPFEKINSDVAVPACERAVRQYPNSSRLISQLGRAYLKSNNFSSALAQFRAAAEQGNAMAQRNLGWMYEDGKGLAKDSVQAIVWYRKAASQGNAAAQNDIGRKYFEGSGVAQDYSEAINWFRRAADQGYAEAMNNLGVTYTTGNGVRSDPAEAMNWFRKAADQGSLTAKKNLGAMNYLGQGVALNYAEALRWYREAADQGDAESQNILGAMYEKGQGVPKSYTEALKWYQKAADQGNEVARNNFSALSARFPAPGGKMNNLPSEDLASSSIKPNQTAATNNKNAGEKPMNVYAIFLCFQASGMCKMQGESRVTFAGVTQDMTFRSLAECEQQAQILSGGIKPNSRGRFENTYAGMWHECRGKHVDTWEPAH